MNAPILSSDLARTILDAVPVPVFVMDSDMRLLDANIAGATLIGSSPGEFLRLRGGDALHCLQAGGNPDGCGHGEHCSECIIRKAVRAAFDGQTLVRQETQMELVKNGKIENTRLWVTTAPFKYADRQMILLTLEDVTELLELRHLLPICAKCKKIRDDHQYWHCLEEFMQDNLNVDFTHGLCPDCLKEMMSLVKTTPMQPHHFAGSSSARVTNTVTHADRLNAELRKKARSKNTSSKLKFKVAPEK